MKIIKRSHWKALKPKFFYYYHLPKEIILYDSYREHKNRNVKMATTFKNEITIREIQRHQMNYKKFIDIAYHFIICQDGDIYEGRPLQVQCPNIDGYKRKGNINIMLVGNFEKELPTKNQINSLINILIYINKNFNYMDISKIVKINKSVSKKNKLNKILHYIQLKMKKGELK